jgi:serpin B
MRKNLIYSLQSQLNPTNANYNLSTANAFWLKKGEDLNDEFQNILLNYYLATGQELDFARDPVGSAKTINSWVENETNGKIKELIKSNMLNGLTYMVLTNAIYFKANWVYQFDEDATEDLDFHLSDGKTVNVPTMRMNDKKIDLNFAQNNDVQMLQLPYKDNETSMYIILPKDNSISDIEQDITSRYIDDLKANLSGEWMDVYLPRFKIEEKYNLNGHLQDMGMQKAFDSGEADLSGIAESGRDDLFISFVVHKSFVEVNEEGTEAAAATAVGVGLTSVQPMPISFKADHPFIFFIEHKETGQILFMGKVEDPSA